jgi:ATP-dependent DNA helicase RecQ
VEGHGALRLTPDSRPLLRGERSLRLRQDRDRGTRRERVSRPAATAFETPGEQALWEALRAHRLELARVQEVPPYVVFADATLRELVARQPADLDQFAAISGVGAVKLKRYGASFLTVLRRHATAPGGPADGPRPRTAGPAADALTDTVQDTLLLLGQGLAIETIAQRRGIKAGTIEEHLARAVTAGVLAPEQAFTALGLDEADVTRIHQTLERILPAGAPRALTPAFEALAGRYSYGALRNVLAAMEATG